MPIKVRCEGCQTVLNVPDQAAGKAVKCNQCGGRVLVPGGESEAAAPAQPRPKARSKAASENPDDVLFGVDLNRAEDTKREFVLDVLVQYEKKTSTVRSVASRSQPEHSVKDND